MKHQLRDYQTLSIDQIRNEFSKGNRKVLLWLATGGGKTTVFCEMIKRSRENGLNSIMVVRGRKLVDQGSQRLFRETVPHGVMMAKHWNKRPHEKVQVCSIDTLISRNQKPEANLIIIDEAHQATSKGYKEFLAKYPDAYIVSVTATPWTDNGLRHCADTMVHPITMDELINQGYLLPFRYYAPSAPDLSEVKVSSSTKDYVNDQLADAMVAGQLTGKIIDNWKKYAENRRTLCFAVNIKHSKILVERFNKAGIRAEHCDAETPDREREALVERLNRHEIDVISNVGIFCTGVDIPMLGAVTMARPTKSMNLYIQQAGRGTRPVYAKGFDLNTVEGRLNAIANSEYKDCILLDHAGNIQQHGFPTDEPEVNLDGKATETFTKTSKICKECFAVYRGPICPECGVKAPPAPQGEIVETDEQLQEITQQNFIEITLKNLIREAKHKGRKKQWAYYKLIDRFGIEKVKDLLPPTFADRYENGIKNVFKNSYMRGFNG